MFFTAAGVLPTCFDSIRPPALKNAPDDIAVRAVFHCRECELALEYAHIAFKTGSWEKKSMQTAIRIILLATAISLIASLSTPAVAAPSCDRECLRGIMTKYLDAVVAHNPQGLPLAKNVRFTENCVDARLGEGIWKTASGLTPYRMDIMDVKQGMVGTHSVIEEGKNTVLLLVRLKVVDKKITEIETQVTRIVPGGQFSNPTELKAVRPAMTQIPPKDKVNSREDLIKIGLTYPEGLKLGSFVKADTPFGADAYRIENGYITAGKGCMNKPACENLKTQPIPTLFEITSRVAAVDEEQGIAWIRMDFGKNSMGFGPEADNQSLIVWEYFKIYDGKIQAIEAFMLAMPRQTPSGWDVK